MNWKKRLRQKPLDSVFKENMKRLRRKYNDADKLTPHLYMALGRVVQFAKDIKFIKN